MKLAPKNTVREYEVTVIVPDSLTQKELDDVLSQLSVQLDRYKAAATSKEDWGKKDLAYSLVKNRRTFTKGWFHHWVISMPGEHVADLNNFLQLQPNVIRSLVVVAEKESSPLQATSQEDVQE